MSKMVLITSSVIVGVCSAATAVIMVNKAKKKKEAEKDTED